MSVSNADVSCHNDIRTEEYVEYVWACSPLHNPDEPMGANLNLSRDMVATKYRNNPYIQTEQWFDQHPGGEEWGTREAILNGRIGPFSNMRCDQYRAIRAADGTKRRIVTFKVEFRQKAIEGTENKPLCFLFENYNVAVPFAAAFTQVNNEWNQSKEDNAPLLTFYTQTPGGYLQLWDRNCPISLGLKDMDVIYGHTGET
jgi:hypothetical protein